MNNQNKLVITVVGMGYVGMSIAVLLAQNYKVYAVDIVQEKLDLINNRISPIQDKDVQQVLLSPDISLIATTDSEMAYRKSNMVIIATPTDFCDSINTFDTNSVEEVICSITQINPRATIVVKSTVPIGFIGELIKKTGNSNIMFSPEFLREGKANAYLALRVSFFNEIDTFAIIKELDAAKIIEGICMDPRIGDYYNNPSFGYGGYCLPKDTKQLLACYKGIPQKIIGAIVESNMIRKKVVADDIYKYVKNKLYINSKGDIGKKGVVGVYRIIMKSKSDNYRQSALFDVIQSIIKQGSDVIIYEPLLENGITFWGGNVVNNLPIFKEMVDVVIANRYADELSDVIEKVYTRDIFGRD